MGGNPQINVRYYKRKPLYNQEKGHSAHSSTKVPINKKGPFHKGPIEHRSIHKGPINPEAKGQQIGISSNGTIYITNIRKKLRNTAAPMPSRGDLGLPPTTVRKPKWAAEIDTPNSEKNTKEEQDPTMHLTLGKPIGKKHEEGIEFLIGS